MLLGGETLIGREVRELLQDTGLADDVRLVTTAETSKVVSDLKNEPRLAFALKDAALANAGVIVLADTPESTHAALAINPKAPLVDLTYGAEDHPRARLRAPLMEPHDFRVPHDAVQVIAHPASIAIALLLTRVHAEYPLRQTLVHVFEPASERGAAGMDELQKQTVTLLSFQPVPKGVFDTQTGFAMLARYGDEAAVRLEDIEARIERHLATLLHMQPSPAPMPSLRVLHAPVFHGHSFSVWLEFEGHAPTVEQLEAVLKEEPFDLRDGSTEPPSNVSVAGLRGVAVGALAPDRNRPNAFWLWMAADNLRLQAQNAIEVLREVL